MTQHPLFVGLDITKLLYIDIETVMQKRDFSDLSQHQKYAWMNKMSKQFPGLINGSLEDADKLWKEHAALYPEFSKIICISIGLFSEGKFRIKTMASDNEINILEAFNSAMEHSSSLTKKLIAHNGKGFDYPFMIKRYLLNGMCPPKKLWFYDKKPWEVEALDSAEIWKFGGFNFSSLDSIACAFNLPSPKADIQGKDVWKYFYNEDGSVNNDNLQRIKLYCSNDVISMVQVIIKMTGSDIELPEFYEES